MVRRAPISRQPSSPLTLRSQPTLAIFDIPDIFANFETCLCLKRHAKEIVATRRREINRGRSLKADMDTIRHRNAEGQSPNRIARGLGVLHGTVYSAESKARKARQSRSSPPCAILDDPPRNRLNTCELFTVYSSNLPYGQFFGSFRPIHGGQRHISIP